MAKKNFTLDDMLSGNESTVKENRIIKDAPATMAEQQPQSKKVSKRADDVRTSVELPKDLMSELWVLVAMQTAAARHKVSLRDVMIEAVEDLLKKHGR